jgi:hypothetical protein
MVLKPTRWLALALSACGAPAPPSDTGGTDVAAGACGRGLVVIESDYQSSNVSLVGLGGEVLSASLISSGSALSGLSAPLSGDVVAPNSPQLGDALVLIDRYPTSVLTWIEVASGEVRAQLDVRTGFASNPQDYLLLAPDEAYVTRYETNASPGAAPFDEGGDVLRIDPAGPAIAGRIDLGVAISDAPGFLPRPGRMVSDGARVWILLAAYDATFSGSAPSRIATIEGGVVTAVTLLEGLHGCSALALEPVTDAPRLAVGCSGHFDGDGNATVAASGVALLSTAASAPSEIARYAAADIGAPVGFGLAFADGPRLLLTTLGNPGIGGRAAVPDTLVALALDSGVATTIAHADPFAFGELRCATPVAGGDTTGCGSCWIGDAGRTMLHRIALDGAVPALAESITVETAVGLPPRGIGRF